MGSAGRAVLLSGGCRSPDRLGHSALGLGRPAEHTGRPPSWGRIVQIGYFLSCEEYGPTDLLDQARWAEQAGFESLWISDHFHPWNDEQGQSPFVWSMIGAVSQVCSLPITTAVTCPTIRTHPAIVAQAAATSAVLTDSRFILGLGSGEALNEHVTGARWPQILPSPRHFEQASTLVTMESTRDSIAYGDDLDRHVDAFRSFAEAGVGRSSHLADGWARGSDECRGLLRVLPRQGTAPPARAVLEPPIAESR